MAAATLVGTPVTDRLNIDTLKNARLPVSRFSALVALKQKLLYVASGTALCVAVAAPVSAQATTMIVSGLGGTEDYQRNFDRYAAAIAEQSKNLSQRPDGVILMPGQAATRERILDQLDALAAQPSGEPFTLYLIGHGSFDGQQYKFNVPGPDLSGEELKAALDRLDDRRQLIVVTTSASGALLELLESEQRVVITATKNGRERNAVQFSAFLSEGIATVSADIDKDESISAEELFNYAERAVAAHYENENLLAAEHARLQGSFADQIEVARYGSRLTLDQSTVAPSLLSRRDELAAEIAALRAGKDSMSEDAYFDSLQNLMLELGKVQREIDGGNQ